MNGGDYHIPQRVQRHLQEVEGIENPRIAGRGKAPISASALIYGPPGTGKSFQSLLRTVARADAEEFGPHDMTIVTYRRSLAEDLIGRVTDWNAFEPPELPKTDPKSAYHHWGTMNAVAARASGFFDSIVEASRGEMMYGLAGMMTEDAAMAFCRHVGVQCKPSAPWFETPWTTYKALYDYAKNNLLDVGNYRFLNSNRLNALRSDIRAERLLEEFNEHWSASFWDVVDVYERWKQEHDVHDFYEQLEAALVGPLPTLNHLVIDEYHDAYPLMAALAERWVENADVAIVAGDPDQVVNAFSGADPRFFERLPSRVSKSLPTIELKRSYRCPDEHFAAAAAVLGEERQPPALQTDGRGAIETYNPPPIEQGTSGTWELPDPGRRGTPTWLWTRYGPRIMFLARTRSQVSGVGAQLDASGIVYQSQRDVAGDWPHRLALMRALRRIENVRPIEQTVLDDLDTINYDPVGSKRFSPEEAWALLHHCEEDHFRRYNRLKSTIEDCLMGPDPTPLPLKKWLRHARGSWYDTYGLGQESIWNLAVSDRLSPHDKRAMEAAWSRYDDRDDWTVSSLSGGTRLMTIHASKGAQAEDVVLYDGVTERIQKETRAHPDVRENEARTWYVGLTRASDRLHIVRDGLDWTRRWLPEDLSVKARQVAATSRRRSADA